MTTLYTTVKTSELRAGDVVRAHGCRFRLTEVVTATHERLPTVYAWRSELLSTDDDAIPFVVGIAQSDPRGWVIQGNDRATWVVEVER